MNSKKTELNKLKEQAETKALKRLQSIFKSPDQLEQIDLQLSKSEKIKVSDQLIYLIFFFSKT